MFVKDIKHQGYFENAGVFSDESDKTLARKCDCSSEPKPSTRFLNKF